MRTKQPHRVHDVALNETQIVRICVALATMDHINDPTGDDDLEFLHDMFADLISTTDADYKHGTLHGFTL